jgi:hypothetical protein
MQLPRSESLVDEIMQLAFEREHSPPSILRVRKPCLQRLSVDHLLPEPEDFAFAPTDETVSRRLPRHSAGIRTCMPSSKHNTATPNNLELSPLSLLF